VQTGQINKNLLVFFMQRVNEMAFEVSAYFIFYNSKQVTAISGNKGHFLGVDLKEGKVEKPRS